MRESKNLLVDSVEVNHLNQHMNVWTLLKAQFGVVGWDQLYNSRVEQVKPHPKRQVLIFMTFSHIPMFTIGRILKCSYWKAHKHSMSYGGFPSFRKTCLTLFGCLFIVKTKLITNKYNWLILVNIIDY